MKKFLSFFAALCCCFALEAQDFNQYDFKAYCTTGQTLYFRIVDKEQHLVYIVAPVSDSSLAWRYINTPFDQIELPETVSHDGTTYTVTGIGDYAFYGCSRLRGSLIIPNSVTSIGLHAFDGCSGFNGTLTLPNSVTSIGRYAFDGCSGFNGTLTLPNSLTIIQDGTFADCSGFTGSLTIPNSAKSIELYAFSGCSGFNGTLTIGNSVESIGYEAFSGCSGFTGSLTIPNSVKSIVYQAFIGCSGFNGSLTIGNSVESIGYEAFSGCSGFTGSLTIGNSVKSIGRYSFKGCSGFTGSLIIPNSVTSIGQRAFAGCSGFNGTLTLPNSITIIEDETFGDCSGFTGSLVIPNSVESIENYAFIGCSGFNGTLTIGNSVKYIGTDAFWSCSGFTGSLIIPNSVETIGMNSFEGCSGFRGSLIIGNSVTSIGQYAFDACSGFRGSLTIGNSVESIGMFAFSGCSSFTGTLTIPSSVTSIGQRAFAGCSGFNALTIPNSLTEIQDYTFADCSRFTGSLIIPNSVTSIGPRAFAGCSGFNGTLAIGRSVGSIDASAFKDTKFIQLISKPATPPVLRDGAFDGMKRVRSIVVPCGSKDLYTAKDWWIDYGYITTEDFLQYDLTATPSNPDFGTVSITQPATCENQEVTIAATPAEGYLFIGWMEDGVLVSTANPYTFTLESDCDLVANILASATCVTGQTLYYRIVDAEKHWMSIVAPNGDNANGWDGFTKPTGNITLPETVTLNGTTYTVTAIDDYAFCHCSNLTGSLTIPTSVTSIGSHAFDGCSGFTDIISKPATPPALGTDAFTDMSESLIITVPCSSGEAYGTSWSDYASMLAEDFVYDLTVASANTELGTVSVTQAAACSNNGKATVTATPAQNGIFRNWMENGKVVSTERSYTFTMTGDRNLVANFKECTYNYEPITAIPSPIDPNAVYVLGYQVGNDYYLHTSGTTAGQMLLSKNPESPIEYHIELFTGALPNFVYAHYGTNYLTIKNDGVSTGGLSPFNSSPYTLVIQNGDISSASASGYTVCHDGDNIITVHTGTSEGNLRFFKPTPRPSYSIAVTASPEGTGTATATVDGEQVESATKETEVTVAATPNNRYKFVNWTENDEVVSTANPYTFTLESDRNLVANFTAAGQYDFSATCTTGQTLYYRIIDAEGRWVSIVAPRSDNYGAWDGFTQPEGDITLPQTVTHNGTTYTVTKISDYAFQDCNKLTGPLTIPTSVTSIGRSAFRNCSGFNGALTIPNTVTNIGPSAFYFCKGLTGSLTIPNLITDIEESVFAGCSGLTGTLNLPSHMKIIKQGSFMRCSGFTGPLIIPSSVTSIESNAFSGCSGFTGPLTIPDAVTSIGIGAFQSCSGFTGLLTIGSSVESIGGSAFSGCSGFTGSLIIPNSVTSIGPQAFNACSGFTGPLTIGSSVESIGELAFFRCSGFTGSLIIGNSVTSIGESAFTGCSGFTGPLTIGCSVESIGEGAFWGCLGLTDIISKSATPPDLGLDKDLYDTFFEMYLSKKLQSIVVPVVSVNAYKREWSNYASLITCIGMLVNANQDPAHDDTYYSTFYSSMNAYQLPEGVTAYTGEANGDVLNLIPIADGIIPADEAVILRLTTDDNTAMTQQIALSLTLETGTKSADNMLQGSDEAKTLPSKSYALSLGQHGVGFYDFSGYTLPAHKAYLTLASGSSISLRFSFGDATDIDAPAIDDMYIDAPVKAYNLQGQQVDENYKGIVIVNGKKMLNN